MLKSSFIFSRICAVVFLLSFVMNAQAEAVWIPFWQATSKMTIARAGAAYVQHGNYVYALGGVDGKVFLDSVERAEINKNGTLGSWSVISQLPEARGFFSAVIFNNRIYAVGGGNGPYGKNLLNSIASVAIQPDGSLGIWRNETNSMLIPRRCAKVFISDSKMYVAGGFGGALLDTVEYASIDSGGKLDEWLLSPEKLNTPRYVNELKKVGDLVFAIGGHHESSGKGISSVEYLDLKGGDKWLPSSTLLQGRYAFASAVVDGNLIVMGGLSGAEYINSIETAEPSSLINGGMWRQTASLPYNMANFSAVVVGKIIYIFGGSTRSRYLNDVWFATVNDKTEIGYYGSEDELARIKQKKLETTKEDLPNRGKVLQIINSNDYTYMLVSMNNGETWLAAPRNNIAVGAAVEFSEGVYMSNFYSKTLNRKFDAILFVGTVINKN